MTELNLLQNTIVETLQSHGIRAMHAFPNSKRKELASPIVVVSISSLHFDQSVYLGERFSAITQSYDEIYALPTKVGFALDIYAPQSTNNNLVIDQIMQDLHMGKTAELTVKEISFKPLKYDRNADCFVQTGNLICEGCIFAVQEMDGSFSSFELRGAITH